MAAPSPETAAFNWTGLYLGGHVGYGAANVDGALDSNGALALTFGLAPAGVIGGVHVGYNHQLGHLVLGIEGDASFADWRDTEGPNADGETGRANIDLLATIRGRVGYAWDRHLIYGTGGVAFVDGTYTAIDSPTDQGSVRFNNIGGVVGGGLDWAVHDNVSLRAEGLYYIFNDSPDVSGLTGDSDATDFAKLKGVWVVRGGASLRLPH